MYLALELLHPGGLSVLVGDHSRSPDWIARLILQIADTLHHAHQAGIIHCDLKPENLLLAPGPDPLRHWPNLDAAGTVQPPQVKITDFGLCKPLDEVSPLTPAGMMLGTPDYMAPEQAPDSVAPEGVTTDIFALGAILYELMVGEPPFHRNNLKQQLRSLQDDDPRPPRQINARVSRELEAICLRCLEKDPLRRYTSAQALAADLNRFLGDEPVRALPMTAWRKLVFWGRRKPVFAGHLSAAVLLYLLHLVEMLILENPAHMGSAHFKLTMVFLFWVSAIALAEWIREHPTRRSLGEYLFALLPMLLLHVEYWIELGRNHSFSAIFLLLIPAAVIIRPSTEMLLVSLIGSLVSFNLFVAIKTQHGDYLIAHEILFFNGILLLMGLAIFLLIRRIAEDR